jgi:MFS family permease
MLAWIGSIQHLGLAIAVLAVWGLAFAATIPVRQAYINGLIPSEQRATVLSFDNMLASGGAAVIQPILGRVADATSYGMSYVVGAGIQSLALPFVALARRERAPADEIRADRPARDPRTP